MLKVALLVVPLGWAVSAQAIPIKWELIDVQFFNTASGGPLDVTGSFVFDADTNAFSDVAISTLDGILITCAIPDNCGGSISSVGPITGQSYVDGFFVNPTTLAFFTEPLDGTSLAGDPILVLALGAAITNAGGEIPLPVGLTVEYFCGAADPTCATPLDITQTPFRSNSVSGGFIRAVPEPSTLALLGIGLLGLTLSRRQRPA